MSHENISPVSSEAHAGAKYKPEAKAHSDWALQSYRVVSTIDNQVRSLRKRVLISASENKERYGVYFSIRGDINDYPTDNKLNCPYEKTQQLADIATDLAAKDTKTQRRLINWGYAICDAGIRSWVEDQLTSPTDFPYPDEKV